MSAFSCPNCQTQLTAEGLDGRRLFCPTCRQEVEAPPAAPADLEAFASVPMAQPDSEAVRPLRPRRRAEVYYDDGFIQVTGDGLLIGDRRYPLRHVVDVEKFGEVRPERRKGPWRVAGIVVGCTLGMILFQVGVNIAPIPGLGLAGLIALVLGVGFVVLGITCALRSGKKIEEHAVVLIDHAGSEEEIWFRGEDRRDKVFAALRDALAPAG